MNSSGIDGFGRRLQQWLHKVGLRDDPFALYKADQEQDYLPFFFVDRPYLYEILGDPAHPQTAFLMAQRGAGKTATREMVAYECTRGRLRGEVLPVHYYDFSFLVKALQTQPPGSLTARQILENVTRAILKTLVQTVPQGLLTRLRGLDRELLLGYAKAFADPISYVFLQKQLDVEPLTVAWDALSSQEMLEAIANLVLQLGSSAEKTYQSIYVLIDRVDETPLGLEGAVDLLSPLVEQRALLEMANVAFKFFLPLSVGEALRQIGDLSSDRLCIQTVSWDREALANVVRQRLAYYSNNGITRLGEICTPSAKAGVMGKLIATSAGSPRTLLRLCHQLIAHHVMRSDDALIDTEDVDQAVHDFRKQVDLEQRRPVAQPSGEAARVIESPAEPPESGLHLDASGHVWVDGERLTPPLSPQEFALLQALHRQAPEIVSREELVETVWPQSTWQNNEVFDQQNLRKLVSRLRKRLQKAAALIKNARGRGYWLHKS